MTYASPYAIRNFVAPDGGVTGTAGELGDEQLQGYCQTAQDLVDGYTGVTFSDGNVPGILRDLATTLATFYATLAYRKGKALEPTHPVYLRYVDAQKTLTGIKNGTINFEPATRADTDAAPVRAKPKVNNAWRSSAEMFPLSEVGLHVTADEGDNEGYRVTQDPGLNSGFG
jgi:hypothetical protein